jgi:hypothetical protein
MNPKLAMETSLVNACGIDASKLPREQIYSLAGQILRDSFVQVLAVNEMNATRHLRPPEKKNAMLSGTTAKVIRAMPAELRAELRERIMPQAAKPKTEVQ